MERPEAIQKSEKKERGKNVKLRLIFLRHAHKAEMDPHAGGVISQSNLSEKGKQASQNLGWTAATEENLKAYVSRFERSLETAENFLIGTLEKEDAPAIFSTRVRPALDAPHFSEEFIDVYRAHFSPKPENFDSLSLDEKEKIIEDIEAPAVEYWLERWDEKFDEETESAAEVAERTAYYFSCFDRMSEKLKSGSQVELMNITHKTVTEPFLIACLKPPLPNLKEAEGPLDLLEGWEIIIETDENGKKSHAVKFRGKEYGIDMAKVAALKKSYFEKRKI